VEDPGFDRAEHLGHQPEEPAVRCPVARGPVTAELRRLRLASGRHLLSLINDILGLSKVEAGRMEFDLASFDLPAALESAVTLVKERAGRNGLHLDLIVDPGLGATVGDEWKVKQILLNPLECGEVHAGGRARHADGGARRWSSRGSRDGRGRGQ
jgi:signal transduction histidine kinase